MKQFMKYLHFSKNITTIVLLVVFVGTYNNVFIVSVNGLTDATGPTELTPDEIAIKKCSLLKVCFAKFRRKLISLINIIHHNSSIHHLR